MGNLGAMELLIIALVVVLLIGTKKLPDMARSLGRSMRVLKAETTTPDRAGQAPEPETLARMQAQIDDLRGQLDARRQESPERSR